MESNYYYMYKVRNITGNTLDLGKGCMLKPGRNAFAYVPEWVYNMNKDSLEVLDYIKKESKTTGKKAEG